MLVPQPLADSNPFSGFDYSKGVKWNIYFLQVKTKSQMLDDALYSLAHPDATDANPHATHNDVVEAVRSIARIYPKYTEIANELANLYEQRYCS